MRLERSENRERGQNEAANLAGQLTLMLNKTVEKS